MNEDHDKRQDQIIYLSTPAVEKTILDYAMDVTAILATIMGIVYIGYEIYIRRKALS